jgi:hypothetical protein
MKTLSKISWKALQPFPQSMCPLFRAAYHDRTDHHLHDRATLSQMCLHDNPVCCSIYIYWPMELELWALGSEFYKQFLCLPCMQHAPYVSQLPLVLVELNSLCVTHGSQKALNPDRKRLLKFVALTIKGWHLEPSTVMKHQTSSSFQHSAACLQPMNMWSSCNMVWLRSQLEQSTFIWKFWSMKQEGKNIRIETVHKFSYKSKWGFPIFSRNRWRRDSSFKHNSWILLSL